MSQIVHTGDELAAALTTISRNLEKEISNKVMKKLTLDAYRFVVQRTPVRTGFLKSRWAVSNGPVPPAEKNPGGTFSPLPPRTSEIKMGDKVTLYNNAEYASYVDQGVAPNMKAQPMIEPTYEFVLGQATRVAAAVSKERKG